MINPEDSYAFKKFTQTVKNTVEQLTSHLNQADLKKYFQMTGPQVTKAQVAILSLGNDMQEKIKGDMIDSFITISKADGFVDHIHQSYQLELQEELFNWIGMRWEEVGMLLSQGYFDIIQDFKDWIEKRALSNDVVYSN